MNRHITDEEIDTMKEEQDKDVEETIAMLQHKKKNLLKSGKSADDEEVKEVDEMMGLV
tara:strand:- start:4339 stop:4512 length:174 start_codon:yes stop_codon:yes gene_type:complete